MPWLGVAVVMLSFLAPTRAAGQFGAIRLPDRVDERATSNWFLEWNGVAAADGWQVDLPADWRLQQAILVEVGRHAEVPVSIAEVSAPGRRYRIVPGARIRGLHELILRVRTGRRTGAAEIDLVPLVRQAEAEKEALRPQEEARVSRQVAVVAAKSEEANLALELGKNEAIPSLDGSLVPGPSAGGSFTLEGWLKTLSLQRVVLSTWNGKDRDAYPFEIMVDLRGRLSWYWGQPGWHQSLTSREPVADGAWHHFAAVFNAERSSYRLYLDGWLVDSLVSATRVESARPMRVSLGGRSEGQDGIERYEGWVDELRFWSGARSPGDIRRAMKVPLRSSGQERLVVDFSSPGTDRLLGRSVARRIQPSDLALLYPVERLRADVANGWVHLEWTVNASQEETFVVERSSTGTAFEAVGRVSELRREETAGRHVYGFDDWTPADGGAVRYYRIRQVFGGGAETMSGTVKVGLGVPEARGGVLLGNSPNPFQTTTTVSIEVRERQPVRLSVWNVSGTLVELLTSGVLEPGVYHYRFDGDDLPSGLYFAVLETPVGSDTAKMTLMK